MQQTKQSLGGLKNDKGKRRWDLLPWDATEEIVKVVEYGASKYGDRNWERGFNFNRLLGAVFRHLIAWARGHDKDPESGISHLAHAACNILFLLSFTIREIGEDDRPLPDEESTVLVSSCCESDYFLVGYTTLYHVCKKCHQPCDVKSIRRQLELPL